MQVKNNRILVGNNTEVMGDFNMPEIDYNDYSVAGSNISFPMQFFNL